MNTISKLTIAGVLSLGLFTAQSCVQDDDYATPPIECNLPSPNISLADLVSKVTAGSIKLDANKAIAEDLIVQAYVISSDETGNFYKTISLQDKVENPTTGIQIEIDGSNLYNSYPLGAQVQINLKGLIVANDRGVMKIGSVDPKYTVGRIPSAVMSTYMVKTCEAIQVIKPKVVTSIEEALKPTNLNTLVTIEGVQFENPEEYLIYTNKEKAIGSQTQVNVPIIDKKGDTTYIRNSFYATFANDVLPTKSGSITIVASRYNSDYQLFIRDTNDVKFDQGRFTVIPEGYEEIKGSKEDFESAKKNNYNTGDLDLTTGTWTFSDGGVFDPSDNDLKSSGTSSVRLRGTSTTIGFLQSKFFVIGLKTLKVNFGGATFSEGADADKEIKLEVLISTDFGVTWKSVGEKTSERGKLNLLEFPINAAATDRVAVKLVNKSFLRSTGNQLRVNIDDIEFVK
ncbi:DUF5689 domain-containing protein [Empedobacter falsenii]|uniref:DUF5689 domain-containing protein n=1 Tax=Empedobacter falsenii TaxID=343874 RepID=A0A3R8SLC9_9FLAO|nr:DUF5689 domain-containing protein [Empedobacter falsenii]RRT91160.1 hypothetical protein EGI89_09475 [Empedobacter falsenii]RRT91170.1 hypothetical protein EGI88_09270 [Empedobacter falsenii]